MPRLPTVEEFTGCTPPEADLDGFCAWKNFGGLDLATAYEKFVSAPEVYQEDFMFMGARAFQFYFPVIDRYLRTVEGPVNRFEDEAWILASAVKFQFEQDVKTLAEIRDPVLELCDHVLGELEKLRADPGHTTSVNRVAKAWKRARDAVGRLSAPLR